MNWLDALYSLELGELRSVCSWLLGRSGIDDRIFIERCLNERGEEE